MRTGYIVGALGVVLLGTACAGAPKPTDQLVKAEAALRAARELGSNDHPAAQLHARLAEEQLQQANELIADGENEQAKRVLERSKSDAEYAVALARKAEAERQLEQAQATMPATNDQSLSLKEPTQ